MKKTLISWAPTILWGTVLFVLSAQSHLPSGLSFPFDDKVAHLLLYLVLGGTLAWAGRDSTRPSAHVALILLGILFALTDEWHQSFVPHRDPSPGDFLADSLGLIVGFVLARKAIRRALGSTEDLHH
jgi:VanZ family protein